MSDATVRVPTGVADGVAAYVREVRSELADLPAEDVDDLTGGSRCGSMPWRPGGLAAWGSGAGTCYEANA